MKKADHIDDDQLVAVLADHGGALTESEGHLALCPMCRERKDRLEQSLLLVGQMAERFSPSPSRLPLSIAREAYRDEIASRHWRRSMTMGLSAASLIVLVVLCGALFFGKQPETVQFFSQEVIQDDLFMKEISRLEEDAIPPAFMDIIDGQISSPDAPPEGRADPDAEYENMS